MVASCPQFVAHPNVQQLLASIWYEGLPGFRQKNMLLQVKPRINWLSWSHNLMLNFRALRFVAWACCFRSLVFATLSLLGGPSPKRWGNPSSNSSATLHHTSHSFVSQIAIERVRGVTAFAQFLLGLHKKIISFLTWVSIYFCFTLQSTLVWMRLLIKFPRSLTRLSSPQFCSSWPHRGSRTSWAGTWPPTPPSGAPSPPPWSTASSPGWPGSSGARSSSSGTWGSRWAKLLF